MVERLFHKPRTQLVVRAIGSVIVVITLPGTTGCRMIRSMIGMPVAEAGRAEPSHDRRTGTAPPDTASAWSAVRNGMPLVFDVLRVDVPAEDAHHLRKVWNHVDELRSDPRTMARLARNGMRAGAAASSSWPAIHAILQLAGGLRERTRVIASRGMPFTLRLATVTEAESIFGYDGRGGLSGKTFLAGDKLAVMTFEPRPVHFGTMDLQLRFELTYDRGSMTWERRGGMIQQVPSIDRTEFPQVSATLTLRTDEMLALGPAESDNEYIMGRRLFSTKRAGRAYATVLFITPKMVAPETVGAASAQHRERGS